MGWILEGVGVQRTLLAVVVGAQLLTRVLELCEPAGVVGGFGAIRLEVEPH